MARARAQAVPWGADGGMRSNRVRNSVPVESEACERLRAMQVIYPDSMPTDTETQRKDESYVEYIDRVSIRPDRHSVYRVSSVWHFEHLELREVRSSHGSSMRHC